VVFAVALLMRLLWISVPLNVDEGLWMRRGPAFLQAVLQGNPAATYQRHHPGVTNMWLIGGAVASRYLLRDVMPAGDLARQTAPELQRDFTRSVAGCSAPQSRASPLRSSCSNPSIWATSDS
jgi:hypothetical protein